MKLLFIHSGEKIKRDTRGNLYTDGSYSADIWTRYFALADQITLLMRSDPAVYTEEEAQQSFNPIPRELRCVYLPDQNRNIRSHFSPRVQRQLDELLREEIARHDAVIVRLPGTGQVIRMAKEAGKPCLAEMVGCPWDALWNHSWKGKLLAPSATWHTKKALREAQAVVYVTNDFLQRRYPTKGIGIGCSDVVLREIDDSVLEKRLAKIAEPRDKYVLGTVAAVDVHYKGQRDVIRALGKLKKQGITNYIYQLVGGGDPSYLRSVARRYHVEDQVVFLGAVPHDEVFAWLDNLDIYIQPSKQEGLPRALVEAMSRALPAIGSDVGGIPELLEQSVVFRSSSVRCAGIRRILQTLDRDRLIEQARRNFAKAGEYREDILDDKRSVFYKNFFETHDKPMT